MGMLDCPNCGSENTKKISQIYQEGTGRSVSNSFAIGSVANRFAYGSGVSHTNTTSNLAKRFEPPRNIPTWKMVLITPVIWGLVAFFIGSVLGGIFDSVLQSKAAIYIGILVLLAIILVIPSVVVYFAWKYALGKQREYQEEMPNWHRRFLCLRCDRVFKADI